MNQTNYAIFDLHLELKRYPFTQKSDLRAWDAADNYLLETIEPLLSEGEKIVIVHDQFGALTLPLLQYQPICYGDSWLSYEATQQNLSSNGLTTKFDFESNLSALIQRAEKPKLVIGRVPKSKRQLAFLLQSLNQWLDEGTQLFLAGMDKHLSRGQFELLESYFGPSAFLPGVKKARIWQARLDKTLFPPKVTASEFAVPEFSLDLTSAPNVFCGDKLDIGTRFFLSHFDKLPACEQVADLACGNGVLGLAYLRMHPKANLFFSDESFQAVASTQGNLNRNLHDVTAQVRADDGLKQLDDNTLDLVICNPPFHQQNTVSKDIAFSMFKDVSRCLRTGGEFWLVANRHLGYHVTLKRLFGNCETVAGSTKFVILRTIKT